MDSITTFTKEALEQFAHTFEDLFYSGDSTRMASYYTDDSQLFGDGIAPTKGRTAIEAFWQATCERGKAMGMKRTISVNEVHTTDDLCYTYSTLELEFTANGQTIQRTVSDITIWRKQADGSWQIEVDISVPDPQKNAS